MQIMRLCKQEKSAGRTMFDCRNKPLSRHQSQIRICPPHDLSHNASGARFDTCVKVETKMLELVVLVNGHHVH